MPQTTTEKATQPAKTLNDYAKLLADMGVISPDNVIRGIILAYESEHLKDFPFFPDKLCGGVDMDTSATRAPAHVQTCPGGAVRGPTVAGQKNGRFEPRYDLMMMNHHAMRRLAEAYGEGQAKGYPEDNWMLGIPESNCLKHLFAHLLMHLAGDKSEDHLGHGMFNLATLIYMQEERPDLMDRTNKKVDKS